MKQKINIGALSSYRILDLTDVRGQIAGMMYWHE